MNTSWQWQLEAPPVDLSSEVDMYDIDLFDNNASVVAALHAQGATELDAGERKAAEVTLKRLGTACERGCSEYESLKRLFEASPKKSAE